MDSLTSARFFDKTWEHLRIAWRNVSRNKLSPTLQLNADLPDEDLTSLRDQMRRCINNTSGKVSARIETAALGRAYLELNHRGRKRFLKVLASDFDVDSAKLDEVIDSWQQSTDNSPRHTRIKKLNEALYPPRLQILTQFNELPEGVKFLVDMRAELITLMKEDAAMAALERDLKQLLTSWFDIGFLRLERITWESSAAMLEKLIDYEAVHEIRSWEDLKNRLASDRRCYAFLHPHMPGEPLIFVEVALTNGLADNIQKLLDETTPAQDLEHADTAIFYSISNAQQGLAGISFGDFLIKRVVTNLSHEFPELKRFSTLSPIANFGPWLTQQLQTKEADLLTPVEQKSLSKQSEKRGLDEGLLNLLNHPDWPNEENLNNGLKPVLTRLAARYLSIEKSSGKRALDPVAHFHLTNGAQIEQLNWMADNSEKGLRQSFGLMVNYLYQIGRIDSNSAAYSDHGTAAASSAIKALLKN